MKTLNIFLASVITLLSFSLQAQTTQAIKKDTVKVWGNCGMCQSKIEKAAKTAGASSAKWDAETQLLFVTYNPSKAGLGKIEKSVAGAGYDTEHEKASDDVYNKLHGCCQYERKATTGKETAEKTN